MAAPVVKALSRNLPAMAALYLCAKHAHWNVQGPVFQPVHELFDKIAADASGWADVIAEHIAFHGEEAVGTPEAVVKSYLKPYSVHVDKEPKHLKAILSFLVQINREVADAIEVCLKANDQVTADIFIEIGRGLAKDIYFVQSYLE